jgi:hypothetical protein
MDAATLTLVLSAISGPASGVVVAMLCMVMFGFFLVKYLLPSQQKIMDNFITESRANRKVFVDAVDVMSRRLEKVEDDVSEIKHSIIKER